MSAAISTPNAAQIYSDVYEQFAVDASFLWVLRSIAVNQPHYTSEDLAELESRVEANLDGLMTAPELSWQICHEAMELGEPGEIFTAAVLAFRSLDVHKIQAAVEAGLASDQAFPGLVSALGWLPGRLCHSWIKKFLTSKDLNHKYLAMAVCSIRREDPREYLETIMKRDDCRAHSKLYARSLRLAGEIKRNDLFKDVCIAMESEDETVAFWAHWSALLLGHKHAVRGLKPYLLQPGPFQARTIELVFRALPVAEARSWIGELAQVKAEVRSVVKATAALGDPHAVNWLIGQMRVPALSRLAGEAFTTITGIDLEQHGLALEDLPNLDELLPNEDPDDDNVTLDEDENLPFPDADKVAAVWQKYCQRFVPGQRYLKGKQLSAEDMLNLASAGTQRFRRIASLELALTDASRLLANHEGRVR